MSASPLYLRVRRNLIKKYIKLSHPRKDRKKAHYWPDISISEDSVYYRKTPVGSARLSSLAELIAPDTTLNQVINIIGSGPSVNDLDLAHLSKHVNIFLNGSISLAIASNLPVFAHVILDPYFIFNRFDLLQNSLPRYNLVLSFGALCAIAERDMSILAKHNIYVFREEDLSPDRVFSDDIDSFVIDGGSVISIAIQFAAICAVEEVRLIGLDIGNARQPRFYETNENAQRNCLLSDFETKIVPFMQAASLCYQKKGIKLVNCSPISKLPYDIIPYWGGYQAIK